VQRVSKAASATAQGGRGRLGRARVPRRRKSRREMGMEGKSLIRSVGILWKPARRVLDPNQGRKICSRRTARIQPAMGTAPARRAGASNQWQRMR
jgi:hypothetical protein